MTKKVDVDWAAFRALVLSGLAIRDVARRLGVNPNTALARAKRDKWDVAKSHGHGRKPDIPKEALARTERTLQAGKDFIAQADAKTKFHLAKAVVSASQTLSNMPGQHIIDNHQALHSVAPPAFSTGMPSTSLLTSPSKVSCFASLQISSPLTKAPSTNSHSNIQIHTLSAISILSPDFRVLIFFQTVF